MVFISLVFIAFFFGVCVFYPTPRATWRLYLLVLFIFSFFFVFAGVIIFFHSLSSEVFYFGGVDFNGRRSLAAAPPPCDWPT